MRLTTLTTHASCIEHILLLLALTCCIAAEDAQQQQQQQPQQQQQDKPEVKQPSYFVELTDSLCTTNALNHAALSECAHGHCAEGRASVGQIWPTSKTPLHVYTLRSGSWFATNRLPRLDYVETHEQHQLDINSTLYIDTSVPMQHILGFGVTLKFDKLVDAIAKRRDFERKYSLALRDLYADNDKGIGLKLLRLDLGQPGSLAGTDGKFDSVPLVLSTLDKALADAGASNVKLVLCFDESATDEATIIKTLARAAEASKSTLKTLSVFAIAFDKSLILTDQNNEQETNAINQLLGAKIFGSTKLSDAATLVDTIFAKQNHYSGLLIKSEKSLPYNMFDYVRNHLSNFTLVAHAADRTLPASLKYGDWHNAHNLAVEILNYIKHGANAFIDNDSIRNVFEVANNADENEIDGCIYNLRPSQATHFRGPMYYALGHFSQFVKPGSRLLQSRVETQPNMFNAQYAAFQADKDHIVAIVLNNNDHILPLRLAIDGMINTQINIEPKSFNSVVIKRD